MELKTSEFFKNIKSLPPEGSSEFNQLIQWEVDKCMSGVRVNGILIPGWLYWHLNHWWIRIDQKDHNGNIIRMESLPYLRDNEWVISDALEQARVNQKGLMIVGARQISKSETEASYTSYNATLFKGSQNVIVGGSEGDLDLLKDKIGFGIKKGWKGIMIPRLDKDWRKSMVRLGYKSKDNEDDIWSYIIIRNVADGNNTEGPAGTTAKSFISDEVAKYPFAQAFEAAKPAFVSEFGWRCVPILSATGGNAEKFADAERYFYHPEANNLMAFTDEKAGKKTGLFMSGLYRQDCKYVTNLGEYLKQTGKIDKDQDVSELSKLEMRVADKQKALDKIEAERRQKALDPDQSEYRKQVMYYPLDVDDCFLSSAASFYNGDIARQQKERIEVDFPGLKVGMYVELEEDINGEVKHKPSTRLPISTFPTKPGEDMNCPVVILEHPVPDPPYGLYVGGIDPYRFEKGEYTDSLGAVYIFKRMYDILADTFQDMPVAWYVGRPDSKDTWNNQARLLLKYYNAQGLCENDEMSFIDYMIAKGDGHMLMDTPEWLKEFIPTSATVQRAKGISSANQKVSDLLRTNLKQYMEEVHQTVPVPGSEESRKVLGVSRIYDPMLLEEIIKWNKDGNFDREKALSIAITAARKLDTLGMSISVAAEDPRFKMPDVNKKRKQGKMIFKPVWKYNTPARSSVQRLIK